MTKNISVKHAHHMKLVGTITHQKDPGNALELIDVPRGPAKIKMPAMFQTVKENPKRSIT